MTATNVPRSVIAVDLGGTKITTAVVADDGSTSFRLKVAVSSGSPEHTIRQLVANVIEATAAAPVSGCGVIVPGIYYAGTGEAWLPNLWGHRNVPLRAELEQRLGMPVVIDSDRAGYVLGEQWLGVARGLTDVIFLAIGTGIGAGILSGGRVMRGAGDIAGAVGWLALTPEFREEYRNWGCFETEAAGPSLARRLGAGSAEEVVAAARRGDPGSTAAVKEAARFLGMGVANLVSVLNPQMIVLGGGLMQAADLFLPDIRRGVEKWAQPIAAHQMAIAVSTLGEDAGLLGAARLALGIE